MTWIKALTCSSVDKPFKHATWKRSARKDSVSLRQLSQRYSLATFLRPHNGQKAGPGQKHILRGGKAGPGRTDGTLESSPSGRMDGTLESATLAGSECRPTLSSNSKAPTQWLTDSNWFQSEAKPTLYGGGSQLVGGDPLGIAQPLTGVS